MLSVTFSWLRNFLFFGSSCEVAAPSINYCSTVVYSFNPIVQCIDLSSATDAEINKSNYNRRTFLVYEWRSGLVDDGPEWWWFGCWLLETKVFCLWQQSSSWMKWKPASTRLLMKPITWRAICPLRLRGCLLGTLESIVRWWFGFRQWKLEIRPKHQISMDWGFFMGTSIDLAFVDNIYQQQYNPLTCGFWWR